MNILLIEDDRRISDFVIKGLEENGFSVHLASNGEQARDLIMEARWDLILMDIMLPGIDGVQLTKLIRYKKNDTPILILSALSDPDDRVNALDSGADDYLTKPFHFKELISRVNALLRRSKYKFENPHEFYQCLDLNVDLQSFKVSRQEEDIELSPKEFKLLVYLMENKNKVLSRTQILNAVWGINYNNFTNVVDVYISYLRNKIDAGHEVKLIHTIKGTGYSLRDM